MDLIRQFDRHAAFRKIDRGHHRVGERQQHGRAMRRRDLDIVSPTPKLWIATTRAGQSQRLLRRWRWYSRSTSRSVRGDSAGRWLTAAAATATAATAKAATATAATPAPATTATATPRHLLQGAAVVFLVEQMECRQADVRDFLLAQRDRLCRREVEFLRHVRSRCG